MLINLLTSTLWTFAVAVPFQVNILHRQSECVWDLLKENESATLSVFILEGSSLKASLILEGPFANPDVESTLDLVAAEHKFTNQRHRWTKHVMYRDTVNFEHLQLPEPDIDEEEQIPRYTDDDYTVPESKEEDMAAIQKQIEERRARQIEIRRQIQEARRKRAELMLEHAQMNAEKVKEEGSPHQKTITARVDGWYRGCIEAEYNRVLVELEFRTTKELDGIDPETNHVYSYEKWQERQEEKTLEEGKPENEPSIKVEDFIGTRNQVRDLNRVLNQMSNMQQAARNRVKRHGELGEHMHSKMTRFSIFMTILFMAAAAFQVFTIQRWFSTGNASLLGR